MTIDKVAQIERMIAEGLNDVEISGLLCIHYIAVRKVRRGEHSHQTRQPLASSTCSEPTLDEIERLSAELRRQRPEDEPDGWMPQTVRTRDFGERF